MRQQRHPNRNRTSRLFGVVLMSIILCLPGCVFFYPSIPDIHFELEDASAGNSLDIMSIDGGRVVGREEDRMTADIGCEDSVLEFRVSNDSRESNFSYRMYANTGLYGPHWRVDSISSVDGSLWIPRKIGNTYVITGEHASGVFLIGRWRSRYYWADEGEVVIRRKVPNTFWLLKTETLAIKCKGRPNTSLALKVGSASSDPLEAILCALPGSHFLLESDGVVQRVELLDNSSKLVAFGKGATSIKWLIPGSDEPQIEVVVDSERTTDFLRMSFSSAAPAKSTALSTPTYR